MALRNTFLYFVGKSNVCNKCIARQTVFKEVRHSEDSLLRKAMRAFGIKSFGQLKDITPKQAEDLEQGKIKDRKGETFRHKSNRGSAVKVDSGEYIEDQEELDLG